MTKKKNIVFKIIFYSLIILSAVLIGFSAYIGVKLFEYNRLPINLNALNEERPVFYDINNNEILSSKNLICDIEELKDYTKSAFISIEDKTFYTHKGVNLKRIVKASIDNAKSKSLVAGGSTITQQLAKNLYLSNDKTLNRKLKEYVIAKKIEKNFSKDQILESYLNNIYFGKNSYGIKQASLTYFNKDVTELTINESAYLAGLINSPSRLSIDTISANNRKNLVLKEMLKDNKISENECNELINTDIILNSNDTNFLAENYINAAVKEVAKKLNLTEDDIYNSNIKIYTNLDLDKQKMLYKELNSTVDKQYNFSGIIIDNKTNAVKAFVSSVQNANSILRQPGSVIKPMLVYAPAIEHNVINEYTLINNEQTDFNNYKPKNANGKYSKEISVKEALSNSTNVAAVKILSYTGIDKSKAVAKQFGLTFDENDNNLAIALGGLTKGENFTNLVNAYTTFADNGLYKDASFVNKILDSNKNFIDFNTQSKKQIIGSDTAFVINDILKESVASGTAKRLNDLNGEIASKTGTVGLTDSKDNSDAYNISYTKSTCIGVHVFSKDTFLPSSVNGSTIPTNVVKNILTKLNLNESFDIPDSIEKVKVDIEELNKGKLILANEFMPDRYIKEIFIPKKIKPTEISKKFLTIEPPKLNLTVTENSVVIEFDAVNYAKTEIYRNNKLIKTIYNTSGKQIVIDEFIPNEKTIYTAKHIVENKITNNTIESELSEPKIVYIEEKDLNQNELDEISEYTTIFENQNTKENSALEFIKKLFKF